MSVVVEYCEPYSDLLHRVTIDVRVVLFVHAHESFVRGEWVRSSDTQRGVVAYHQRRLCAMAIEAHKQNISSVRVKL